MSDNESASIKIGGMHHTANIRIGGMHCAACVGNVEKAVAGIDGVREVAVNLASETAYISYDAEIAEIADFEKAISEAGY